VNVVIRVRDNWYSKTVKLEDNSLTKIGTLTIEPYEITHFVPVTSSSCPSDSFEVSLTWTGATNDLDLHIFEKGDNNHVYNEEVNGIFGDLSADM
jgi:hypothetical protein